jgi:hypothetical protein
MHDLLFAQAKSALSPNFYLKISFYNADKEHRFHGAVFGYIHYTASRKPASVMHISARRKTATH